MLYPHSKLLCRCGQVKSHVWQISWRSATMENSWGTIPEKNPGNFKLKCLITGLKEGPKEHLKKLKERLCITESKEKNYQNIIQKKAIVLRWGDQRYAKSILLTIWIFPPLVVAENCDFVLACVWVNFVSLIFFFFFLI